MTAKKNKKESLDPALTGRPPVKGPLMDPLKVVQTARAGRASQVVTMTLAQEVKRYLSLPAHLGPVYDTSQATCMDDLKGKNVPMRAIIAVNYLNQALQGKPDAVKWVTEMAGEGPATKIDITTNGNDLVQNIAFVDISSEEMVRRNWDRIKQIADKSGIILDDEKTYVEGKRQ